MLISVQCLARQSELDEGTRHLIVGGRDMSAAEVNWLVPMLALPVIAFQEWRYRRRGEDVRKRHETESELTDKTILDLRGKLGERDKEINSLRSALLEDARALATLTASNDRLGNNLDGQAAALAIKDEKLAANAATIAHLETKLAEEASKRSALLNPKPHVTRPRSPFEIQCTDEWLLTKLLPEALRYCHESVAYRLAETVPDNTEVHVINEAGGDVINCIVAREDGSIIADARRWSTAVDGEHNDLLPLKDEATLFAVKVHIAIGHFEYLNMDECADLARDFIHLLATSGAAMLRILAGMSLSIKMDALGRKSGHIILLLESTQIGRLNAIFVAAGEQYREETIDPNRIMPLRQKLLSSNGNCSRNYSADRQRLRTCELSKSSGDK
jgi:hypothetical protein